jgi:hypothetical protein
MIDGTHSNSAISHLVQLTSVDPQRHSIPCPIDKTLSKSPTSNHYFILEGGFSTPNKRSIRGAEFERDALN